MKKLILTITVLLPLLAKAQPQDKKQFSGKVLTTELKPVEGAAVFISFSDGTTSGRLTDEDGSFTMSFEKHEKAFLRLSFLGFKTIHDTTWSKDFSKTKNYILYPESKNLESINITSFILADPHTPVASQTLSKAEIRKNNMAQDLPVILNSTPSLVYTTDAGAGVGYTSFRIRGSDAARTNFTINGIPVNDAETQGVFFVNMPDLISSATRVDIQRGVGTSANGAGAFGANVNIETIDRSNKAGFEFNNSYGSFNTYKNTVAFNTGLLNDQWALNGRLSQIGSDGYIDRASSNLKSYYLAGSYHSLNNKFSLDFINFAGNERTYQSWWGTPESRVNGDVQEMNNYADRNFLTSEQRESLLNSGRTYNFYDYKNQTDNYGQKHFQLHGNYQVNENIKVSLSGFYVKGGGYYENYENDQFFEDYGIEPYLTGNDTVFSSDMVTTLALDNQFFGAVYGLHYQKDKLFIQYGGSTSRYLGNNLDDVIWAQFSGNMPYDYRFSQSSSFKNDFNNFVRAGLEILPKLNLYADMQLRLVSYNSSGMDDYRNPYSFEQNYSFFNPKGGLNYQISKNSRAYISLAKAQREPVRMDFIESAPEIPKPEKLLDYELGYQKISHKYIIGANIFYMDYRDQLVLTGELNNVGGTIRRNVGKSHRTGIELQGAYLITKNLKLSANATFSENKIHEYREVVSDWYGVIGDKYFEYKNTPISFSPSVISAVNLEYKPIKELTLGITGKYVGAQYLDNSGREESLLDAYFVGDFRVSYKLPFKSVESEIVLLVNNFTNQMYSSNGYTYKYFLGSESEFYTDKMLYPQAGINYLFGLNIRF